MEERLRKSVTTRVTAKSNRYTLKDNKVQSYIDQNGNAYQIGGHSFSFPRLITRHFVLFLLADQIYLETNKSNEPYSIASILDFRLVCSNENPPLAFFTFPSSLQTRKDHVLLEVCWYYRPSEIPVNLYHILIEDRYQENRM